MNIASGTTPSRSRWESARMSISRAPSATAFAAFSGSTRARLALARCSNFSTGTLLFRSELRGDLLVRRAAPAARRALARRLRLHDLAQEPPGVRLGDARHLLRRARRDDRAAFLTALGTEVDDAVGCLDH